MPTNLDTGADAPFKGAAVLEALMLLVERASYKTFLESWKAVHGVAKLIFRCAVAGKLHESYK
jgi:hypothetical protein